MTSLTVLLKVQRWIDQNFRVILRFRSVPFEIGDCRDMMVSF